MKKILIAGGAGFIGSHLCKKLLDEGNKVVCIDNLYTGFLGNIQSLKSNNRFQFINFNVACELSQLSDITCHIEFDEIYNLASPASPPQYMKNPITTLLTNINGTYSLLRLAQMDEAKFLQTSTSEVYGDPLQHPQTESYFGNVNTWGPRANYDEGKRVAETFCYEYRNFIDVRVARIFNTYGPNMDMYDGRVISNIICQALQNKPITIYGTGEQTRSFCYVDDMVEGLIALMDSDCKSPLNLGNPGEFTINELADIILEMTGSKSEKVYLTKPQDDPMQRKPDISYAMENLNWTPKVSLEEGLEKTINYFKGVI